MSEIIEKVNLTLKERKKEEEEEKTWGGGEQMTLSSNVLPHVLVCCCVQMAQFPSKIQSFPLKYQHCLALIKAPGLAIDGIL